MSSLTRLKKNAPNWVTDHTATNSNFVFSAISEKPSGAPGKTYELVIEEKHDSIEVREQSGRELLPNCCVERHINPGGTFCVFYNSTKAIPSDDVAKAWWIGLQRYLSDQEYARKHKEWPIHRGLSHGDAASIQLKMEELADKYGWRPELLHGMFRNMGWLGEPLGTIDKKTGKLRNQRSACPRGCHYIHNPTLKANCAGRACAKGCKKLHPPVLKVDCPNRQAVNQIAHWEHQRRSHERALIAQIKSDGVTCCGTMKRCMLDD